MIVPEWNADDYLFVMEVRGESPSGLPTIYQSQMRVTCHVLTDAAIDVRARLVANALDRAERAGITATAEECEVYLLDDRFPRPHPRIRV